MVLDKLKNFVKSDKGEKEKKPGRKKGNLGKKMRSPGEQPAKMNRRNKNRRPGNTRGASRGTREKSKGGRNRDLGLPSEERAKNLPEIPESATGGGGRRTEKPSPGGRPGGRTESGPGEALKRPEGSPRRRDIGTGGRERRTEGGGGSDETLQRVLDKLEDIDRRLERLERRM